MNTTLRCRIHGLGVTFFDDEISLVLLIQEVKEYWYRWICIYKFQRVKFE